MFFECVVCGESENMGVHFLFCFTFLFFLLLFSSRGIELTHLCQLNNAWTFQDPKRLNTLYACALGEGLIFYVNWKKTNAAFDYDGHLTIGQVYSRHYTTLLWQGTPVCTCDLVFLFSFLIVFCSGVVKYMLWLFPVFSEVDFVSDDFSLSLGTVVDVRPPPYPMSLLSCGLMKVDRLAVVPFDAVGTGDMEPFRDKDPVSRPNG